MGRANATAAAAARTKRAAWRMEDLLAPKNWVRDTVQANRGDAAGRLDRCRPAGIVASEARRAETNWQAVSAVVHLAEIDQLRLVTSQNGTSRGHRRRAR